MTPEPKPIQRLIRSLLVLVGVCVLGLIAGIVLVSVQNADTNRRLSILEDYVQGKGEQRDRENSRLQEQQRQGMCDLLDQFPEGGWLERPRAKYGCGPGIPIDKLTPEEQQNLNGRGARPSAPAAADGVESSPEGFTFSDGADPNVQPQQPYYPTPGVAEPPATVPYPPGFPPPDPVQPTGPPLVDLSPVTDPLCQALGVCA